MITVGRRWVAGDAWEDQARLSRTAAFLRGDAALVPRGVFRFGSFEEAEAWMNRTLAATHERRNRRTSSESVAR